MIYKLFSTFDRVAGTFESPAPFVSEPVAIRAFKNVIDNETSFTGLNYRDFDLFEVGLFDTSTGVIEPVSPRFVTSGRDIKGAVNNDTEE
mgnify:FL=1